MRPRSGRLRACHRGMWRSAFTESRTFWRSGSTKAKIMREDQSREELRAVWQTQPTGTTIMSTKLIHSKARELHGKTRRQLIGTVAGPLAATFFYVFGVSV